MKITRHSLLSKSDTFVSKHVVESDTHIVRITLTDGHRPDSDVPEDRARYDVKVYSRDVPRRAQVKATYFAPRFPVVAIDSDETILDIAERAVAQAC